jgi:hypothetical protein
MPFEPANNQTPSPIWTDGARNVLKAICQKGELESLKEKDRFIISDGIAVMIKYNPIQLTAIIIISSLLIGVTMVPV